MRLIERLRELEAQATPGPWTVDGEDVRSGDIHVNCHGHDYDEYGGWMTTADIELVVALRGAATALLAVAEAAQSLDRVATWSALNRPETASLRAALATLDSDIRRVESASCVPVVGT